MAMITRRGRRRGIARSAPPPLFLSLSLSLSLFLSRAPSSLLGFGGGFSISLLFRRRSWFFFFLRGRRRSWWVVRSENCENVFRGRSLGPPASWAFSSLRFCLENELICLNFLDH